MYHFSERLGTHVFKSSNSLVFIPKMGSRRKQLGGRNIKLLWQSIAVKTIHRYNPEGYLDAHFAFWLMVFICAFITKTALC
jgi:hypothetical protein